MNRLLKPAILSISFLIIMTGSAVSPALAKIREAFPYTSRSFIKMVVTLPSLVLIPFSLLSGRISSYIKKRTIIIVGIIIYIIGGAGGGFSRNIYELLFFRFIIGIGVGLLLPLSTSLIADFFTGSERTHLMGLSNAIANLGSIISTLITGWIAIINWRYVFGVYVIAIVVLVFVLVGLPEPEKKSIGKRNDYFIDNKVIMLSLLGFLLNIAFYSFVTNIALFVNDRNLGNSGTAGIAMSILTLAGFLSGIFLEYISSVLKNIRVPLSIGLMALGFILLGTIYNLSSIFISSFMIGFGLGILKPILILKVTEVTPKFSNAFSISIVSSSLFLGKFMSPFILTLLGNLLKNTSTDFIFTLVGILLSGASFLALQIILHPKISIRQ